MAVGAPLLPSVGPYMAELAELPPAFLLSGLAGVLISLIDRPGRERLAGIDAELAESAR